MGERILLPNALGKYNSGLALAMGRPGSRSGPGYHTFRHAVVTHVLESGMTFERLRSCWASRGPNNDDAYSPPQLRPRGVRSPVDGL